MIAALTTALLLVASPDPAPRDHPCGDLVILGRVKSQTYLGPDPEDDLFHMNGVWRLRIHVKRVLAGVEKRREIEARMVVHGYLRRDRDFRFAVLSLPDGTNEVLSPDDCPAAK
jgi:hypothetical protein